MGLAYYGDTLMETDYPKSEETKASVSHFGVLKGTLKEAVEELVRVWELDPENEELTGLVRRAKQALKLENNDYVTVKQELQERDEKTESVQTLFAELKEKFSNEAYVLHKVMLAYFVMTMIIAMMAWVLIEARLQPIYNYFGITR